ncbi:MAG: hypothetical protein IPM16_20280 [Chloroflexi bacterium]|nr:hypothetical protein [Chloroflexota bacterium]
MSLHILAPSQLPRLRPSFIIPANIVLSVVAFAAAYYVYWLSTLLANTHFVPELAVGVRRIWVRLLVVEACLVLLGCLALIAWRKNIFTLSVLIPGAFWIAILGMAMIFGYRQLTWCRPKSPLLDSSIVYCQFGLDYADAQLNPNGITYTLLKIYPDP